MYKKGIEISVKGRYFDLLAYMEKMEKTPRRMFWNEASLNVSDYPNAVMRLVIYTLSENQHEPL